MSELLRSAETACEVEEERVDSTLAAKGKKLTEILQAADDLRLRTLKVVLEILTPIQAVHFLIAAAELHSRLHDWGKKKEDDSYLLTKSLHLFSWFFQSSTRINFH